MSSLHLFAAPLAQTLGEGYAPHKQDVFVRKAFKEENGGNHEFLSEELLPLFQRQTLYRQRLLPHHHTGEQEEPSDVVRQQEMA